NRDTIMLDNPDPLIVETSFLDPTCNGDDGSINLNPSGGAPSGIYAFNWNDGNNQQNRNGLHSGEYQVTVTDDNGCTLPFLFNLDGEEGLEVTAVIVEHISCFGLDDGVLMADVNIQGDFSFTWLLGGQIVGNTDTLTKAGPGEYTIIVRDTLRDCEAMDMITLLAPDEFILVANFILPTCPGLSNGSIGAIVAGGTPDYSYEWDNGSAQSVRSAIRAGEYSVTVTDQEGCMLSETFILTDPPSILVDVDQIEGVTCFGTSDGRATATAAGGTINDGRYNFFWSSGAPDVTTGVSMSTASSLAAGRQFLIVVDDACPSDTIYFDVPDIERIQIDLAQSIINDPNCFNGCDGSITASASGGNPADYNYQWSFNGTINHTLAGLCSGIYTLTITDANNCSVMDSFELNNPDSLFIRIDPANTVDVNCFNAGEAQIGVMAGGGTPSLVYTWTNNVSSGTVATSLPDGTYFITVTDANGCTDVVSYTLVSPEPIEAQIPQPAPPPCFGQRTCIEVLSVTGGTGSNYTYAVNRGNRITLDSCLQVLAGNYTVTVFDEAGCSVDYTLSIDQPEDLSVDLGPDIQISLGESSPPINASIQSFFDITSIAWTPVDSLRCMTSDCQVVTVFPQSDTRYRVVVTDENGCSSFDEIEVFVTRRRNVFMANIFSPNNDGFNDIFEVKTGPGVELVRQFHIFDRWGNLIFTRENYVPDNAGTHGWDGTYRNRPLMPGVYAYIAKVRFIDNEEITFKGSVTLIR
ncbi:MAG TPA: gliding motility-associated C-terminal domain-containing protein, partial [Saprospiraceae bacterium]|nr:gliding motility-associated C-terminal domain-containing protein [Saprospiraceae bacterium]